MILHFVLCLGVHFGRSFCVDVTCGLGPGICWWCLTNCTPASAGILWNLSSKDNLKEKVAKDTLPQLTEKILVPLSAGKDSDDSQQSASDVEIFCNTTGCLRYWHR